jgi:hypothetical protein
MNSLRDSNRNPTHPIQEALDLLEVGIKFGNKPALAPLSERY